MSQALSVELAGRGIRVNGIAPGLVPTSFAAALLGGSTGKEAATAAGESMRRVQAPPPAAGPMFPRASIPPTAAALSREEVQQLNPGNLVGRLGRPEDMAACVAYLASDDASYVTGETLVVAGGVQSRL